MTVSRLGVKKGEPRRFVNHHNRRGASMPEEAKRKIGDASRGQRNPAWKGDAAGYGAIHMWLYRQVKKTGRCSRCGEERKTHWANLSGEYRRAVEDFAEMCVPCHKQMDLARGPQTRFDLSRAAP